jgi:hypothetical protein
MRYLQSLLLKFLSKIEVFLAKLLILSSGLYYHPAPPPPQEVAFKNNIDEVIGIGMVLKGGFTAV